MAFNAEEVTQLRMIVREEGSAVLDEKFGPAFIQAFEPFALSIQQSFDQVQGDIDLLKSDVRELKADVKDINFKLSDTVRRSEYHDLKFRVEKLEKAEHS